MSAAGPTPDDLDALLLLADAGDDPLAVLLRAWREDVRESP